MAQYKYWDRVANSAIVTNGSLIGDGNENIHIVKTGPTRTPNDTLLRTMVGFRLSVQIVGTLPAPLPADWGPRMGVSVQAGFGEAGLANWPPSIDPADPEVILIEFAPVTVQPAPVEPAPGSSYWQTYAPLESHAMRKGLWDPTDPTVYGSFTAFSPDNVGRHGGPAVNYVAWMYLATLWGSSSPS